jgi:hypothetical protein
MIRPKTGPGRVGRRRKRKRSGSGTIATFIDIESSGGPVHSLLDIPDPGDPKTRGIKKKIKAQLNRRLIIKL